MSGKQEGSVQRREFDTDGVCANLIGEAEMIAASTACKYIHAQQIRSDKCRMTLYYDAHTTLSPCRPSFDKLRPVSAQFPANHAVHTRKWK